MPVLVENHPLWLTVAQYLLARLEHHHAVFQFDRLSSGLGSDCWADYEYLINLGHLFEAGSALIERSEISRYEEENQINERLMLTKSSVSS